MSYKHMKRWSSSSLFNRVMQIKTTMTYYFTPARMAIIKRQKITIAEARRNWNFDTLLGGR